MPSNWGDSITLRSFAPLPWRTWMTPRALSMSSIRSPATSEALSPAAIGGGERGTALQAGYGLEELNHFVGAEHDRQLARFSRIGNALRVECLAERDAVEKP